MKIRVSVDTMKFDASAKATNMADMSMENIIKAMDNKSVFLASSGFVESMVMLV